MAELLYKILWGSWLVLFGVATAGTIIYNISFRSTSVPLILKKHESVDVDVFRVFPHALSPILHFSNEQQRIRPELGLWRSDSDWKEESVIRFENPGEPVRLLIADSSGATVYEALPASGRGRSSQRREFVPFHDDGDDTAFVWPSSGHRVVRGKQSFRITVLRVGDTLDGEKVRISIRPPITFKRVEPYYSWFWWFWLWPFFYVALLKYAILILLVKAWKLNRGNIYE